MAMDPESPVILFTGNPMAGIDAPDPTNVRTGTLNVDGLTLQAQTASAGTAIHAVFSSAQGKWHTAIIQNIEIRGSEKAQSPTGYWTTGIDLFKASNAVIDKVDISGAQGSNGNTVTGIQWASPTNAATTGIQLTNLEIKWCNTAIVTAGWVEGFYMSGFEVVLCGTGTGNPPALNLASSRSSLPSPAFTLINGHVHMIGSGVKMTNLSAIKVSHVELIHFPPTPTDSTFLELTNCIDAIISDNSFTSQADTFANENGVFLTSTRDARVSGNIFRDLKPTQAGSCIVANTGSPPSSTIRVTDNIFDHVRLQNGQPYNNLIGTEFYYDTDNIVK